jgi:uncharacterized protein DUF1524
MPENLRTDDEILDTVDWPDMPPAQRARILALLDNPALRHRPEDHDLALQALFGAYRDEVNATPIPELVDTAAACRVIRAARLRHRLRMGALRWAFFAWIVVLVAVVLWWVVGCGSVTPVKPGFTSAPAATTAPTPNPTSVTSRTPQPCPGEKLGACPDSPSGDPCDTPLIGMCQVGISARIHPAGVPPYHRDAFGKDWATVNGHCDTREAVLARDAGPAARDDDGDGCKDDAPVTDPYTGRLTAASQADVDHVFALGDAWYAGAYKWSEAQRVIFANDQSNLRAVGRSINRSKGDLGPDEWAPQTCEGRHVYATIYRATAQRWHLELTPAKDAALTGDMAPC